MSGRTTHVSPGAPSEAEALEQKTSPVARVVSAVAGTKRRLLALALVIAFGVGLTTPLHVGSAFPYQHFTFANTLGNFSQTDFMYTQGGVTYGDWDCLGSLCAIPIFTTRQYVDVQNPSYEFDCWFHEVPTVWGENFRSGNRKMNQGNTPWINDQNTWGFADSFSGDQDIFVSSGLTGDCWIFGAGSGAHYFMHIVRNSTSAYTGLYGW